MLGITSGSQNVAVGQQALFTGTTSTLNTAIGSQALQNATGDANTALGNFAGNLLTTGSSNILIGNQAGGAGAGALDTGDNNVVIGNCVSVASSSSDCQLAIGVNTMCWLTGNSTGAIKPGAGIIDCAASTGTAGQVLMSNGANAICWGAAGGGGGSPATISAQGTVYGSTPDDFVSNTAFGYQAGQSATGGSGIFIGSYVDGSRTGAGNGVIAIGGDSALRFAGADNQLVIQNSQGLNSYYLRAWCSGGACFFQPGGGLVDSAGNGPVAGRILTGTSSSAQAWCAPSFVGCSLYTAKGVILSASAASTPTALSVGTNGQVLYANSACATGLCWGAAGGASAATPTVAGTVFGCTTNNFNAFLGCQAGQTATGATNIAIGGCALATAVTGNGNTAVGAFALLNATGNNNTAVGRSAMLAATTGCGNIQVGGFSSSGTNSPVFAVTTENDRVVMGSTAITNAYVQVAWTVTSDARDKTNVTALPVGLDFVNQLNPVSFQFKESRECDTATGPVRYGFLAQEVLAAEGENPVIVDTEVPEHLKVTNDHFNAVLVKAIQELSAKVEALEAKLASNG
jgi:hypothetical protein